MTPLEKEALDTCLEILEVFVANKPLGRNDFMVTIGHLRDTIRHLEARQSGCPTGTHASYCDCKPAILGHSHDWKYKHKKAGGLNETNS